MHEPLIGGPLGNWLAIIGLVSLLYWGWRIFAALQHRGSGGHKATDAAGVVAAPAAPAAAAPAASADDIAVIAAAVAAMLGVHRIVHLEAVGQDQTWASEGRWMQQTSHSPR